MSDRQGLVLAFDCSGGACSAAVAREGEVLAHRFVALERGHAELLVPQIDAVMAEAALGFERLSAIVTTIGPGSFTGLRIGLAAAHGLALATGLPVLAATSFEAYLAGIGDAGSRPVAAVIDSRRGPVFGQIFVGGEAAEPHSVEPAEAGAWLPRAAVLVTGDGTAPFQALGRPDLDIRPARIDAGPLALAAFGRPSQAWHRPLRPLYLRPPDVTLKPA